MSQQSITEVERMPWPLPRFDAIAKCTEYRARVGMKPAFRHLADAQAYEAGFSGYPIIPNGEPGSPALRGYFDAERSQDLKDEARADAAAGAE